MSYTDDAALSRLSALNDTQDSIATAAQWFLFHKKHAEHTVELWHQRLRDSSSSKRLTLIYLANEVAQQSKARRKDEFVLAFSPVIATATATAYRGASPEVQSRILRVVDVWKQRAVFSDSVLAEIDSRIQEVDKARGGALTGSSSRGGGQSAASAALPPELAPIAEAMNGTLKKVVPARSALTESQENFARVMESSAPPPAAPVLAARLNGLLRNLGTAETALSDSMKAREKFVDSIAQLLAQAQADLASDANCLREVIVRRGQVEAKKNEVEMEIMRSLTSEKPKSPEEEPGNNTLQPPEPERPAVEALTPPPGNDTGPFDPPSLVDSSEPRRESQAPGIELLSNLASQYQSVPVHTNGANKKRKLDGADEFPDLGVDDGIEADVVESLNKEGHTIESVKP